MLDDAFSGLVDAVSCSETLVSVRRTGSVH